MNKGRLKEFAIWGRKELIEKIEERLALLGITKDSIEEGKVSGNEIQLKNVGFVNKKYYDEIIRRYKELGYKELVEESAYTWFNRLVAFAYMEINEYYHEKMIISTTSKETPDILDKFIEANFFQKLQDEEKEEIFKLQDEHKLEELYARLVDYKDKELSTIMPFMFRKDLDYLMLLFPKNILMKDSFISKLSKEIQDVKVEYEEIVPVEIIGWLYQFYNSEPKAEVDLKVKKGKKVSKEEIPAKTQLFTPDWIVKYMVENSLGKLAIESLGVKKEIKNNWEYFIDSEEERIEEIKKIEDIKIIDPSMGSGHMLTYAVDILFEIYEELGWTKKEAALSILKNNIYGLEIDKRANQLASFAVIMKIKEHYKRIFKELEKNYSLNTLPTKESNNIRKGTIEIIRKNKLDCLMELIEEFHDAKEYGSILKLKEIDITKIEEEIEKIKEISNNREQTKLFGEGTLLVEVKNMEEDIQILEELLKSYIIMTDKYDVVITNPPYMGGKYYSPILKKYIDKNYKDSKADLFSVFMEKCKELTIEKGYNAMIVMPSWLFLSSFKILRNKILRDQVIESLLHMGRGIFGIDWGSVAFVLKNEKNILAKGNYYRLHKRTFQYIDSKDIEKLFIYSKNNFEYKYNFDLYRDNVCENRIPEKGVETGQQIRYEVNQKDFEKIPGSPIAYWVSDRVKEIFEKSEKLGDVGKSIQGMITGDNNYFLRTWQEINIGKIRKKWIPYNKGGDSRKWYGNKEFLLNWFKNGNDLTRSRTKNKDFYFKEGITWSFLSSSKFSAKYFEKGELWDVANSPYFGFKNQFYILGFLNTNICSKILSITNPTLNYQVENILKLPIKIETLDLKKDKVNSLVQQNIDIAKKEWDSRETSWDFESLGMLSGSSLEEGINNYCDEWKEKFYQMHKNEEELNKIFIDIYGLQNEMDEFVDINDITLLKNELIREGKSNKLVLDKNNEIIFNKEELIKQFLSYAVGCIMGRYSLDKKGLIIANSDDNLVINKNSFEIKDNEGERRHKIENPKFIPDEYGIIPITNTKIFENDIVDMIIKFVEVSFGEENLEENLKFIGNILNKNGNSPREAIRNYFIKDFYTDHLKRYKRRPIYWMLSSGKTNSFQALVYMHRYEENTVGRIRTDYLNRYQEFIEMQKKYFENQSENEELSPKERKNADKELKKIGIEEKELTIYANNVKHIAEKRISIDLDDGVKVNYGKFKEILKKI